MIKRERGVLTYLSQEVNGLTRSNVVGGIHLAENVNEKVEEVLYEKQKEEKEQDVER